jgi:hypothetical protein
MGQIDFDGSNSTVKADIIRGQTGTTVKLGGVLDTDGNYIQTEKGGDLTSASPLVIDTDGDYFDVTGTVSFAAMTVAADRQFTLQFDGALTMTHHATNLDLPGEANITTAAGDVAVFQSTGANTVQCISYTKADGTGIVAAAGGKILQVVEDTLAAETNSSSSTYADTNLSLSITPANTANSILVIANMTSVLAITSDTGVSLKLLRDSTDIVETENAAKSGDTLATSVTVALQKLDAPSTTSATTYKVQIKSSANSATARISGGNTVCSIVAMEIDGT